MTALWTIAPMETLFADENKLPSYREINCAGTTVLVEDVSSEMCKVVQVLSTNPMDFLVDQLQPGTVLQRNSDFF